MSEPVALKVEVLTLFPRMISAYVSESILGKAAEKGLISVNALDIRAFAEGKHKVTDDAPYGGGAGMVMKVDPLVRAIEDARARLPGAKAYLMSPRGQRFDQSVARNLAAESTAGLILVCGRYEGVDERVMPSVDGELSVGDYVLTGGELAALCVVDAVARLRPGVLGNEGSAGAESFEEGMLEHPHYTRPPEFRGAKVPEVLQCGDHARIARWRRWQALRLTRDRRPDMFQRLELSAKDRKLMELTEDEL
jgi:tRNA (guanine37-N1)-methyltransferase